MANAEGSPIPISKQAARDFDLKSRPSGSVSNLGKLERSLFFAETAMISYLVDVEAHQAAGILGFDEASYIDRGGAQAYVFANSTDRVVACRGTEPNEWNDIKADANAFRDAAETVGRVHRGFKREVDDLWPLIREHLVDDGKSLWFTGHSLGGALATICARRCKLDTMPVTPVEVHTFGSPRVGSKRYVAHAEVAHLRWVNNNDLVTRVPPTWLGHIHTGKRMYLDSDGVYRPGFGGKRPAKDRWRGFRKGLRNHKIDHFADHAVANYVEFIADAVDSTAPHE